MALPDFTPKPSYYAFSNWVSKASRSCGPSAIELLGLSALTGGTVRVDFAAATGFAYTLQGSTDLVTWSGVVSNITSATTLHQAEDSTPAASVLRFYRVLWPGTP